MKRKEMITYVLQQLGLIYPDKRFNFYKRNRNRDYDEICEILSEDKFGEHTLTMVLPIIEFDRGHMIFKFHDNHNNGSKVDVVNYCYDIDLGKFDIILKNLYNKKIPMIHNRKKNLKKDFQ